MPWISKKRLHEMEQSSKNEAINAKSLERAKRYERDKDVMAAFTTLWPKHAESLRNQADPSGILRDMSRFPYLYGDTDISSKCLDTLIETAAVARKRLDAERIQDDETRRISELRTGTAKKLEERLA